MINAHKQKIATGAIFIVLGLIAMQIPFTKLLGANIKFTLFDFYGPVVGAFLGTLPGLLTVFLMQILNWAWHGFQTDAGTLIRFLPTLAAVIYFSRKSIYTLIVPIIAMAAFIAHPEGRLAWYYSLYWLIPIAAYLLRDRSVLARALGATFSAHAVGGALWIWVFNMKAAVWISLIPIVWKERGLMALGITLTYFAFEKLVQISVVKGWLPRALFASAAGMVSK